MSRREFRSLAAPEAVRDTIESLDIGSGAETVRLLEAHDRVLAERVDAGIDVPGFDRAAMDGFAVRATETFGASEMAPAELSVVDTVRAGASPERSVTETTAVEIATGAVLPEGADAVVPVEQTVERNGIVEILSPVAPGDHVMVRGADIAAGDRALGPGTRLGPRHIGLLAALGRERVRVRDRPAVAVVSTGAELVEPGGELDHRSGQIYDVNSHSIASAVRAAGGEPTVYSTTTDDPEQIRETVRAGSRDCSLVLTSGSTSAGRGDVLYQILEDEGEKLEHGVAVKPGRPLLVGRLFDTPYVGLPGYPVSALMAFTHFLAPALHPTDGVDQPGRSNGVSATLKTRVRYDGGRLRLLPVGLVEDGDGSVLAYAPLKQSGATTTLAETDGFVRKAPHRAELPPESTVTVRQFDSRNEIPPLLGVGDPDPLFFRLLDELSNPRFLRLGEPDARRWLENGIPDVVLTTAPAESYDKPVETLGTWSRSWGLAAGSDTLQGVDGVTDLAEQELSFASVDEELSVRRSFEETASSIEPLPSAGRELPGLASAVRAVGDGQADVGLGLERTALEHGLEFLRLGTQTVHLLVADGRGEKPAVAKLRGLLDGRLAALLEELPGYRPDDSR